jgi:hypothetical protein
LNFPPRAQGNEPSLDPYARNIRDKERSLLTWQLRDYLRWLTGVLNGTSNYGSLDAEVGGELESERALIAQAIAFFTTEPSTAGFRSVPVPSTL